MLTFTCEHEKTYCKKVWRCIFGSAPTLSQINATYGENTAAAWLVPLIFDVSEFSGCAKKLSKAQISELANIIVENYHWLKVTEVMLYFWWIKSGKYGRFYGSVDPMIFTEILPQFIQDRNAIIAKRDQIEEEKKHSEWKKNAMTYQEWRAKHEKDGI